ncbi:diguanylate cyclase domain-containing protein [Methylophaga frappieri]|nr:diguanylate cyclase [Methylophaga frappieri]
MTQPENFTQDALTSQANVLEALLKQWHEAIEHESSVSVFLIKIDAYEEIEKKAACTRKILHKINQLLNRQDDHLCHFNRNMIMFITSELSYRQACQFAERIQASIVSLGLQQQINQTASAGITLSIGHVTYSPQREDTVGILDILSAAVRYCQEASKAGGNRCQTRLHTTVLR